MTQRHFPAGTCDTHMHIYDSRYPVAPTSLLRPPDATVDHYRRVQAYLGLQRVVVVQPTTYGFDNSCTLDAVAELGGEARAIVVNRRSDDRPSTRAAGATRDATHEYPPVTRLAQRLVQHAPERMLWATNRSHPGQASLPSSADLSRLACDWLPDVTVRRRILVDNPAELYQFEPIAPS